MALSEVLDGGLPGPSPLSPYNWTSALAALSAATATSLLPTTAFAEGPEDQAGGPDTPCNASGPTPMPERWMSQLSWYTNGVLTAAVTSLGLVGNALAVTVLTRPTMHTSTNCFLTALAIWDSVVLLVSLLLISLGEVVPTFSRDALPYVVVYLYPVGLVAQTATLWLTVSFTVERYIAVCHPLQAASMCTIQRARIVIIVIALVAVLYNIPRWFEYQLKHSKDPLTNATCLNVLPTALGENKVYHKIYFGWLYFLVMCIIPLFSLVVLNTFLVRAVRHSQRQRKDMMNVKQSRENNVTIMLVSVVMVFIICQVPALIYNMAYAIDIDYVRTHVAWNVLSTFRNFLVNVNSAVNFILYCALGQKFRRTFVRTFCPCVARKARDGFHSFTGSHYGDVQHNSASTSQNGAVYIKLLKGSARVKGGSLALRGSARGGDGGEGSGKKTKKPKPQLNGQSNKVKGAEVAGGPGSLSGSKTEVSKAADQDSGVVVLKYSSPRGSVESATTNCDSAIYLASSGRGRTKSRVSERSLLSKSRDDV